MTYRGFQLHDSVMYPLAIFRLGSFVAYAENLSDACRLIDRLLSEGK